MAKDTKPHDAAALRRDLGFLTEAEVAALLGITVATARNRQSAGRLPPHYRLGGNKLFKRAEVEKWITRQRVDKAVA